MHEKKKIFEVQINMIINSKEIEERVIRFREDLFNQSALYVVRKYIVNGSCFVLSDDLQLQLRTEIANKYNLHPNEVLIVGSGKLGFSIAPKKRYRHFCDSSDIDVAVVSKVLFDQLWEKVHYYFEHGGYWERFTFSEFKNYLFHGWIRPDKLPQATSFELAKEWWEFFNALSHTRKYSAFKVRGAIYRSLYFLESYQLLSVSACRDAIIEVKQ